jgi:hypothetical protein
MIVSSLFKTEPGEKSGDRKIIAQKDLPADTVLCRFWGPLISYEDTKALKQKESYALQISRESYRLLDPPYRYFNHSCDPNCGLNPALDLILIKPVKAGEELRWDYSTSMMERDWKMACTCGKPNCRKVISDFDKLPVSVQEYYINLNVVQAYILKAIMQDRRMRNAS